MANNLFLVVVTPHEQLVSERVERVVAPGSEGQFGALRGHVPFLTALKQGTLKYVNVQGEEQYLFVNGGFAEVQPDRVTVLAESAERGSDIDIARAQAAKERAEQRLANRAADFDLVRAEMSLRRAIQRISIAST